MAAGGGVLRRFDGLVPTAAAETLEPCAPRTISSDLDDAMSEPQDPYSLAMRAMEQHRLHLRSLILRPAVATWSLLVVLALVYGWLLYVNMHVVGEFRLNPQPSLLHGASWAEPIRSQGEYYRLVSAIFVHANLLHLGMNGYGLYILGPALEKFYGWQKYVVIFVIAGLGGTVTSSLWGDVPSVGASGAIFGIIGGTGVLGAKYRKLLPQPIARQMIKGAVILFVANLAIGLAVPQIDMAAHLGGAVAGAIAAFVIPSDISHTSRSSIWKNTAAAAALALSVWGIAGMVEKADACGMSETSFVHCYQHELRRQMDAQQPR